MKSVVIASKDETEVQKIEKEILKEFNPRVIHSPEEVARLGENVDLIVLDHSFTEHSGIDFLMEILSRQDLPIVMLAPADDYTCALEAVKLGAQSYLVKTGNYHHLLSLSIKGAFERFTKQKDLKDTVVTLRKRVSELEKRLGITAEKVVVQVPPQKKEKNPYEEIAERLKKGEIKLPTIPQISIQFREMVKRGASVQELTNLLKHDAAISSSLIQISNSPYYRGVAKNSTLEQAITRLGINVAKMQVDLIANKSVYSGVGTEHAHVTKSLWEHSLCSAYGSKMISELAGSKGSEEAFTMGLLHDIGKLGLIKILSELEASGTLGRKMDEKELVSMLDTYHCEFGATLLKSWKFPPEYLQITMYHSKLEAADPISKALMIVHMANLLAKSLGYGEARNGKTDLEGSASYQFLKLDPTKLATVKGQVEKLMAEWGNLLGSSG